MIACLGSSIFQKALTANEKRPPDEAGGRMIISYERTGKPGLLRVIHFRSRSCLDLLELRKRTQAGCFWLTGAAHAGHGEHCKNRGDESGKNADHGICEVLGKFVEIPAHQELEKSNRPIIHGKNRAESLIWMGRRMLAG